MKRTYTCELCGKTHTTKRTIEDAIKEKNEIWGDIPLSECAIVCDSCFKKMNRDLLIKDFLKTHKEELDRLRKKKEKHWSKTAIKMFPDGQPKGGKKE